MRPYTIPFRIPVFHIRISLFLFVFIHQGKFVLKAQQHAILDKVLDITQQYSMYRKDVHWDSLRREVYSIAQQEQDTLKSLKQSVGYLLAVLHDNHSFILYKKNYIGNINRPNVSDNLNENTKVALKNGGGSIIRTVRLAANVAYISVPQMSSAPDNRLDETNHVGQRLRDSLCSLDLMHLAGIIVDMRLNTGGDMYPMIGGLAPLLGDGRAGSFLKDGKVAHNWRVKHGDVYLGKTKFTHLNGCYKAKQKIKIALLTGPLTSSAGEATVISFKGKENVRVFGEPTAGLVTGNEKFTIAPDVFYFISMVTAADRTGKVYKSAILPDDQIIGGDNFDDLQKDQKVLAALQWLTGK